MSFASSAFSRLASIHPVLSQLQVCQMERQMTPFVMERLETRVRDCPRRKSGNSEQRRGLMLLSEIQSRSLLPFLKSRVLLNRDLLYHFARITDAHIFFKKVLLSTLASSPLKREGMCKSRAKDTDQALQGHSSSLSCLALATNDPKRNLHLAKDRSTASKSDYSA